MAGLIKKQILKILTKFTSGLQPEDIQACILNSMLWLFCNTTIRVATRIDKNISKESEASGNPSYEGFGVTDLKH